MSLHERYGLTRIINVAGSYTPLGVSRSSAAVAAAAAEALRHCFVIDDLQDAASAAISRFSGAEAGAVTHCTAAGITVSVAAVMTRGEPTRVAALPATRGMPDRVVLPAAHAVNYGHPIEQDIRLAGAVPVLAGTAAGCTADDLHAALDHPDTACLLLVSSRLVQGAPIDFRNAVALAHRRGVPAIVDGAAQDFRIGDLLATGADLVLASAQKYLASPTAGLVIGRRGLVEAVRAQERGIGRSMKPTKEAIVGVLAAIEERERLDLAAWRQVQELKVAAFIDRAARLPGVAVRAVADPTGLPFARVHLHVGAGLACGDARALARALRSGSPSIRIMEQRLDDGEMVFELVQAGDDDVDIILRRLAEALV